jgi:hypothetical protein
MRVEKMRKIKDYWTSSAYSFLGDEYGIWEEKGIEEMIDDFGSDQDLIEHYLNKKYPKTKYFVLIDYDDDNMGSFHIRVWHL